MWRTQFEKRSGEKSIKMECGTRLGVYHFLLLLSAAQILAIGKFVLFLGWIVKNNNIFYCVAQNYHLLLDVEFVRETLFNLEEFCFVLMHIIPNTIKNKNL